jgi:hypothetical protein
MLVWRLNLAWKSGHPNQCLRLGDDAKTNRTLRACFRESASYSSSLSARAKTLLSRACSRSPLALACVELFKPRILCPFACARKSAKAAGLAGRVKQRT